MSDREDGGCLPFVLLLVIGFGVYQCSNRAPDGYSSREDYAADVAADVAADAAADAVADLDGSTYSDIDGSGCISDCSGHDAGFAWAQENEVLDSSDCGGNSSSFIEGCEAYAEEVESRAQRAAEAAEEAALAGNYEP